MSNSLTGINPNELVIKGEKIYFGEREQLEKSNFGQFAVIDVDSGEIFIDADKYTAIQKAKSKHPEKIFYIVQIGNLSSRMAPEVNEVKKYGWTF